MFGLQPRPLDAGLPAPTPVMEPVEAIVRERAVMTTLPVIVTAPVMTSSSYAYEPAATAPASVVVVANADGRSAADKRPRARRMSGERRGRAAR